MNPGVTIHTMQLSGDTRQRDALLNSLDNQHWLGETDQRIIFIRKISVFGYWWELAQKISQYSNDQVMQLIRQKNYQDDQLAVFNNYADLAADVIRNLLAGEKPWYVVRWLQQENLTADPAAVLQHRIYELPSVLENLKGDNQLSLLFTKIGTQELQGLLFSLSAISPVLSSLEVDSLGEVDESIMFSFSQSVLNWIRQYLSLSPVHSSDQHQLTMLKLVSCLSAWKFMPQVLSDAEGFLKWHSAVAQVYRRILHPTLTLPLARGGDRSHSAENKDSSSSPLPRGRLGGGEDLNIENILHDEIEIPKKNLSKFLINQAGLFFLLNLLKSHPTLTLPLATTVWMQKGRATQEQLPRGGDRSHSAESRESSPSPLLRGRLGGGEKPERLGGESPWLYIHQLFQKIAKTFSFNLQPNLTDLLISISHLTPEEFQEGLSQEELSQENPLVDQWFFHLKEKLTKMNLWNADWLQISANAEVDEAYVNFYLDNSAVNLDLRMTGLDVNPGWVPWLGRVIYFHYGDYPELRSNRVDAL